MSQRKELNTLLAEHDVNEALETLVNNGMISVSDLATIMSNKRKEKVLSIHNYPITRLNGSDSKNQRWQTKVDTLNGKSKVIRKTYEDDLYDALYEHYFSTEIGIKAYSLKDIFPLWISDKEAEKYAPTTIRKYHTHWHKYYEKASIDILSVPVTDVGLHLLKEWRNALLSENELTRKEYTNIVTILNQCLDWAVESEIIERNLFRGVKVNPKAFKPQNRGTSTDRVFQKEELAKLTKLAWSDGLSENRKKHKLIPFAFLFHLQCGLRVGELAALKHEDIDIDKRTVYINKMYRFETKETVSPKGTFGERSVFLTEEAIKIVKAARKLQLELNSSSEYVFSLYDEPPCYDSFYEQYNRYYEAIDSHKRGTHVCRRTYVTALMDCKAVPTEAIREACGHNEIATTLNNYTYSMKTPDELIPVFESALDWNS